MTCTLATESGLSDLLRPLRDKGFIEVDGAEFVDGNASSNSPAKDARRRVLASQFWARFRRGRCVKRSRTLVSGSTAWARSLTGIRTTSSCVWRVIR